MYDHVIILLYFSFLFFVFIFILLTPYLSLAAISEIDFCRKCKENVLLNNSRPTRKDHAWKFHMGNPKVNSSTISIAQMEMVIFYFGFGRNVKEITMSWSHALTCLQAITCGNCPYSVSRSKADIKSHSRKVHRNEPLRFTDGRPEFAVQLSKETTECFGAVRQKWRHRYSIFFWLFFKACLLD